VLRHKVVQSYIVFVQSIGVGRKGRQHRKPCADAEGWALAQRQVQGQELEEGRLSRAGIAQNDQAVVPGKQVQHGGRFAQAADQPLGIRCRHPPSGQQRFAAPGFPFGQLQARPERHIEVQQRQLQWHAVGNAHALEAEIAVAADQCLVVVFGCPLQGFLGWRGGPQGAQQGRHGFGDVDVLVLDDLIAPDEVAAGVDAFADMRAAAGMDRIRHG
jgi:hypothetical protein